MRSLHHRRVQQLVAVLQKNARVAARNKRDIVREIGIPFFLLIALAVVCNLAREPQHAAVLDYGTVLVPSLAQLLSTPSSPPLPQAVWFAPCSVSVASTVLNVASRFQAATGVSSVSCFPCEEGCPGSLLAAYRWPAADLLAAIVVDNATALPFSYRIRMNAAAYAPGAGSSATSPVYDSNGLPLPPDASATVYLPTMLALQLALDDAVSAVIAEEHGVPAPPAVTLSTRQFPSLAYDGGVVTSALVLVVPIYMTLIFTLQVRVLLTRILEEKETKITMMLKMMGLSDGVWWLSWLITTVVKNLLLIIVVALVASLGGIFTSADPGVIIVLFALFELTCIGFALAVSTLFSKSKTGGVFGMIAYISLALPSYAFAVGLGGAVSSGVKLVLCLLAPFAFNLSISVVMKAQQLHRPLNWVTVGDPDLSPIGLSLGSLMGMLALDAALYLALAFYLTKVVRSEYGTAQHPLWCLGWRSAAKHFSSGDLEGLRRAEALGGQQQQRRRRFRCRWPVRTSGTGGLGAPSPAAAATAVAAADGGGMLPQTPALSGEGTSLIPPGSDALQPTPGCEAPMGELDLLSLTAAGDAIDEEEETRIQGVGDKTPLEGVRVRGLSKVFRSRGVSRLAVDDFSLSFREGQVTCLLGHNGAGKSTLINMLTGLYPPSCGDASVCGSSILCDMDAIRGVIGVCPQEDVLFNELTVEEHLMLCGGIRGMGGPALRERIAALLEELDLADKRSSRARHLSGGQKRRLSLAMAMLGDPKVLFLDEPTSGLDPSSRRRVWGLVERYKPGHIIVLTTHFMDEADVLGDRIALMARGRLRVCGSSLHLKNTFGLGYRLLVTLTTSAAIAADADAVLGAEDRTHEGATAAAAAAVAALVAEHVPSAVAAQQALGEGGPATHPPPTGASAAGEMTFTLPRASVSAFPPLFEALDTLRARGAIGHYSVAISSLEDVYLRLSSVLEAEDGGGTTAPRVQNGVPQLGRQAGASPTAAVGEASASFSLQPSSSSSSSVSVPVAVPPELDWLDVSKRRISPPDRGAPSPAASPSRQWRQVTVHVWRRKTEMTRDVRSIWLQWVTPLLFVAAGIVLTLLRDVGGDAAAAPVAFTPAQFNAAGPPAGGFSLPLFISSGGNGDPAAGALAVTGFAASYPAATPGAPVTFPVPLAMNATAVDRSIAAASYAAAALVFAVSAAPGLQPWNVTLLYNTSLTNSIPIMASLIDSTLLALALSNAGVPAVAGPLISAGFDPLPLTSGDGETALGNFLSLGLIGLAVAMGFNTVAAIQAVHIVEERESQCKQLALIMGETPFAYWAATWLWDAAQFLVPGAGTLVIIGVGVGHDYHHLNIVALGVLLFAFGVALPGPTYALSFAFSSHVTAQMYTRLGFSALTLALFFTSFALEYPSLTASFPGQASLALAVRYIGYLFPPYALAMGVADVGILSDCSEAMEAAGYPITCASNFPFTWPAAGAKIAFLLLSAPVWAAVLLHLEGRHLRARPRAPRNCSAHTAATKAAALPSTEEPLVGARKDGPSRGFLEDEDVRAERVRVDALVASGSSSSSSSDGGVAPSSTGILLHGLRKVFSGRRGGQPLVGVADLSLQCKPGECFALLGHNGAGKTTTLSMLVGDQSATDGEVFICGTDSLALRRSAQGVVGYTPQVDALFGLLTGDEVLSYYAALSGLDRPSLVAVVDGALGALDLHRHRHVETRFYSGGTKRRLSLAVAYITAPLAVFLDEPSTGVDPVARRRMFEVIKRARPGRATLLTTHVMEDADSLADSIGIMVDGRLACIGSPAHLKRTYGRGYQVHVETAARAVEGDAAAAVAGIRAVLQSASLGRVELLDANCRHFSFEAEGVQLPRLFRNLEAARGQLGIVDYSVSETSLEQVFLAISRRRRIRGEAPLGSTGEDGAQATDGGV